MQKSNWPIMKTLRGVIRKKSVSYIQYNIYNKMPSSVARAYIYLYKLTQFNPSNMHVSFLGSIDLQNKKKHKKTFCLQNCRRRYPDTP